MALQCCNGKVLHVDLTTGKTWVENPPESFYRTYGGGSAMGLHYILKETPRGKDPLSSDNILTLFTGIPTGLPISGQSRLTASARSPLTGAIGDSQCGGFLPARMKSAGIDGIVIRGRAPKPVYLWIKDGEVEIRDAAHLWGKLTDETEDMIRNELADNKVEILQIGPAGEKMVRFAALINMVNRANGRTGMGAVMGSKNLKAVALQGNHKIKAADPRTISAMFKEGSKGIKERGMHINGTAGSVSALQAAGGLPTRNFNEGQFENYEAISGETMTETILAERDTCFSCTLRCKRVVKTAYRDQEVLERFGGPEYETIAALGSYCGVSDLNAIALANQLCNQYGIDTITCGATIAFAMECFENGLLTPDDTGGLDLHFGNAEVLVRLVEMIGQRRGFGDLLAEGSQRLAERIGQNAEDYLITSKGQEAPAHMPQHKKVMGLIYAVNPFGADHESSEHDPCIETGADEITQARMAQLGFSELQPSGSTTAEKVRMIYETQKFFSALDSFCLCMFVWGPSFQVYGPRQTVEMLQAATGWDIDLDEILEIGERRVNMMRVFNAREGFDRRNDSLSKKFFRPLQGSGPNAGAHFTPEQFEKLKDEYYRLAGWDSTTGNPTPEKLEQLGIAWLLP